MLLHRTFAVLKDCDCFLNVCLQLDFLSHYGDDIEIKCGTGLT